MQRLKEPDVPQVDFGLQSTGFEELFTLPEPKPQELLDIQEDNRKGRLLDSLNKIGGGPMDESVDFIEREELKFGGTPLTEEQVQAILDSYNDYKKQKGALPNLTNVVDNFTAEQKKILGKSGNIYSCLLYTSPSPRDGLLSRMPSSA